jgi:hypothetical protein
VPLQCAVKNTTFAEAENDPRSNKTGAIQVLDSLLLWMGAQFKRIRDLMVLSERQIVVLETVISSGAHRSFTGASEEIIRVTETLLENGALCATYGIRFAPFDTHLYGRGNVLVFWSLHDLMNVTLKTLFPFLIRRLHMSHEMSTGSTFFCADLLTIERPC